MMKHKCWFLVVSILLFILQTFVIAAQEDWTGGGYGYDPTSEEGGGSSGSGAGVPGIDVEGEVDVTDFCEYYNVCTALTLDVGIYCFFDDRGNGDWDVRRVVKYPTTWSGYVSEENEKLNLDEHFIDDLIDDDYELKEPLFVEDGPWSYSWDYTYWAAVPWITKNVEDDVRLYRYEGKGVESDAQFPGGYGCRGYGGYFLAYNITADEQYGIDQGNNGQETVYHSSLPEENPWLTPGDWIGQWADIDGESVGTDIVWDEDDFDCGKIGGDWLENEDDFDDNDGHSYYCCGDDYIWVNNRPLTKEESGFDMSDLEEAKESITEISDSDEENAANIALAAAYCLYSSLEEGSGDPIYIDPSEDEDYYECSRTEFDVYDEALDLSKEEWEDCYDDEENLLSTCPFLLTAMYDDPDTDLGKWSALEYDDTPYNPQVCRITAPLEETEGVPQFAWNNSNDAGDAKGENGYPLTIGGEEVTDLSDEEKRATTICEQYLGGTWTGAYCCGNKYDYDTEFLDEQGYYSESFSDTTPIYWYEGSTEDIFANYACVDGTAVDTKNTAEKEGTDGQIYELLNVDGNLSSCAVEDLSVLDDDYYKKAPLVEKGSAYDVAACDVVEGQLCSYNPDAETGYFEWQWEDRTTSDYVTNTLLYSEGDSFTLSTAKWASTEGYTQDSACCAGNACWDGDACVSEYTIYTYGEDADSDGTKDEVAICSAGDWQYPTEPKYDWYDNTDVEGVEYCAHPYACVCSSNEDDNTFCTENDAYLEAGCTLVEDFYKDDHFCEAQDTDDDGSYDSSQWTSRTKFLAFQLLDIAETGTDFTLFCDKYSAAINNYANLEPVEDDINNVCVLEQGGKVTLGITLNSDDDDEPMTVDANKLLFNSNSKSIVLNILEEDAVDNCDDAISYTSTKRVGEFYSCDSSSTAWYNNNLSALIYSKDSLDYTTIIDHPDIDGKQSDFDAYTDTIITHIADATDEGTLVNPDGTPLSTYFAEFNNVQDYNSIYYNYDADTGNTFFGFQEIKYSENAGANRYYTAVLYNGYTLDCNQIYAPYDTAWPIYCNKNAGIILERSTTGSEYWNDLTAAIRLE